MPEIKYEITEHLGVISETSRGWTREVNMISWNGREPKVLPLQRKNFLSSQRLLKKCNVNRRNFCSALMLF